MKSRARSFTASSESTSRRNCSSLISSTSAARSPGLRSKAATNSSSTCAQRSAFIRLIPADLTIEPHLGYIPISHNGSAMHAQHFRCFVNAQPAEEAKLDHPRLALIHLRQPVQSFIQGQQVCGALCRFDGGFVQREPPRESAAFLRRVRARMVNQDVTHGAGGGSKKVRAVLPGGL